MVKNHQKKPYGLEEIKRNAKKKCNGIKINKSIWVEFFVKVGSLHSTVP